MKLPTFSIIIPVYNAEHYLPHCMESLLNQSYHDFEIVLINDGSTDQSGLLCDEYANNDKRVKVFHTSNQGAGQARNVGLNYATGEYVLFVDSDDWLELEALAIYVKSIQSYDWLIGCSHNCYFKGDSMESMKVDYYYPANQYDSRQAIREMYVDIAVNGVSHAPHNKVYKREIIEKYQLRFPNRPKYEDLAFNNAYVDKINSLVIINDHTYNYRVSNLEGVAQKLPANMFDIFTDVNNELIQLLKNWKVWNERSEHLLQSKYITDVASCINNTYNPNLTYTFESRYTYIKAILEHEKVQQSCKHVDSSKFVNVIARLMSIKSTLLIMCCYQLKTTIRRIVQR